LRDGATPSREVVDLPAFVALIGDR
jgi:hypothetical protein